MEPLKAYCIQNLKQIEELLNTLNKEQYNTAVESLSNSTIGQHTRHILEFYSCLVCNSDQTISYDNRKRDLNLETMPNMALETIATLCEQICELNDSRINLAGDYCEDNGVCVSVETTVFRELAYCLEHSIHHQALIKVGLFEMGIKHKVNSNFGIAPATIRHQKNCVNA